MKTKKKCYRVTLDWQRNDVEQGTYSDKVWAKDVATAVKIIASEMADALRLTGKGRRERIDEWITSAGAFAVDDIAIDIKNDLYDLMAGEGGVMSTDTQRAYRVILDLLALHGVGEGS
jgi:hypothetical protein